MDSKTQKLFNAACMDYFKNDFSKTYPCPERSFVGNATIKLRDVSGAILSETTVKQAERIAESGAYGFLAIDLDTVVQNYIITKEQEQHAKLAQQQAQSRQAAAALGAIASVVARSHIGVTTAVDTDGDGIADTITSFFT